MANIEFKPNHNTPEHMAKVLEVIQEGTPEAVGIRIGQVYVDKSSSAYSGFIDLVKDITIETRNKFRSEETYEHVLVHIYSYDHIEDAGKTPENSKHYAKESKSSIHDFYYYHMRNHFKFESVKEMKDYFQVIDSDSFDITQYEVHTVQENALVHIGSADHLKAMKEGMDTKKDALDKFIGAIQVKATQQRLVLEKFKSQLEARMAKFQDEIRRVESVLWTIELYLGIEETVVQIQEGTPASAEEPLHLFQTPSFMDEEVGDPWDGGLDFKNVRDFDDWLVRKNHKGVRNYEEILYPRSVMLFRVRRHEKDYGDINPYLKLELDTKNQKTYILIRNGDQIYRIWADINIRKFFPDQDEFQKMKEDRWYNNDPEKMENRLKDAFLKYQRHMILLQGLIDRTEVFSPMPKIRLQDLPEQVKYLYTGRMMLPTERPMFKDWVKSINEKLTDGCRIVWPNWSDMGYRSNGRHSDLKEQDRFSEQYYTWRGENYNLPDPPLPGLYQVEGLDSSKWDYPFIKIRNKKSWEREEDCKGRRKIQYRIHFEEDCLINYDLCTLDDVEYYLNSRADRPQYLYMMPLLFEIRKYLLKDKEREEKFGEMVKGVFLKEGVTVEDWVIIKNIDWWKTKNKWKRSLEIDDSKAFRMIVKKICSELKINSKSILKF